MKKFLTIMRDLMFIHVLLLPNKAKLRGSEFTSSRAKSLSVTPEALCGLVAARCPSLTLKAAWENVV
jgi:hypothetical protein